MDLSNIPQIIGQWNRDKYGNSTLIQICEELYVNPITKQIQLSGIPDEHSDIQISGYNQVYDVDNIGVTDFKVVSWNDRRVQFHSSQGSKLAKVKYKSRGVEYLSARSIFTCVNEKGEVIETLEDVLERSTEEIKLINTLGNAVIIIRKLEQDVANAQVISNELANNISIANPLNNSLGNLVTQAQSIEPLLEAENIEANRVLPLITIEVDSANVLLPQLTSQNDRGEQLLATGGVATKSEVLEVDSKINKSIRLKQSNTEFLSKAMQKLRKGQNCSFAFVGDSTFYGTDFNSVDKRPADNVPADNGTTHLVTRASKTCPEAFLEFLNKVYNNKITMINKGYSGDGTKKGFERWNASGKDVCLFNYGINDASNSSIEYMGNLEIYLQYYRKLIEREILNGTAVVLVTPIKQKVPFGAGDENDRTDVDIFGNAVEMLGKEYNVPVIDGNVLLEGISNELYSDGTHLNGQGYTVYGTRLASIFVGEGSHKPYIINGYDMLGGNQLLDNFKLSPGAIIVQGGTYPTPSESTLSNNGLAIQLQNGESVTYSFYCDKPNIVAIPCLFNGNSTGKVVMKLDDGVKQGEIQNYYTKFNGHLFDRTLEPSMVEINISDLQNQRYGLYMIDNIEQPRLFITTRGWHTITISYESTLPTEYINFFGLEFINNDDFKQQIYQTVETTLVNCQAFDEARRPRLRIDSNGNVAFTGNIINALVSSTDEIISFDSKYAPATPTAHMVSVSPNIGYGIIQVMPTGKIMFMYSTTSSSNTGIFYDVFWKMK